MAAHPCPPTAAFHLHPELERFVVTAPEHVVWRFHGHDKATYLPFGPIFFSEREDSRWDFKGDPLVTNSGGTLCLGKTFAGALMEYFDRDWPGFLEAKGSVLAKQRALFAHDLTHVYVTRIRIPKGLKLFDLTKPGAMNAIGFKLDAWLTATKEYKDTRPWSRWFSQCGKIDGLIFSSRPGGAQVMNYVLFNRPGLAKVLQSSAGKTRALGRWEAQLTKAAEHLLFVIISAPAAAKP
jgi:hypothetical protein